MDKDEREVNQAPETAGAPGEQKAAGKKKGFVKRLGALLLILAVVLTVAVLSTMEDGRHFAALRRWLMYGESGATEDMYVYSADPNNRFGQMKEGLLVVTPKSIRLHRDDGTTSTICPSPWMRRPCLWAGSRRWSAAWAAVPSTGWTARAFWRH